MNLSGKNNLLKKLQQADESVGENQWAGEATGMFITV